MHIDSCNKKFGIIEKFGVIKIIHSEKETLTFSIPTFPFLYEYNINRFESVLVLEDFKKQEGNLAMI